MIWYVIDPVTHTISKSADPPTAPSHVGDTYLGAPFHGKSPDCGGVHVDWPGRIRVSTVFLGSDHGFGGPSVFFETMVFADGSYQSEYQRRYGTWDEAVAGHEVAVEFARSMLRPGETVERHDRTVRP